MTGEKEVELLTEEGVVLVPALVAGVASSVERTLAGVGATGLPGEVIISVKATPTTTKETIRALADSGMFIVFFITILYTSSFKLANQGEREYKVGTHSLDRFDRETAPHLFHHLERNPKAQARPPDFFCFLGFDAVKLFK